MDSFIGRPKWRVNYSEIGAINLEDEQIFLGGVSEWFSANNSGYMIVGVIRSKRKMCFHLLKCFETKRILYHVEILSGTLRHTFFNNCKRNNNLFHYIQNVDIPGLGFGQSEYFPYVYYKLSIDMVEQKAI